MNTDTVTTLSEAHALGFSNTKVARRKPRTSGANKAKPSAAIAVEPEPVARTTKADTILTLLRRKKGTSIGEMQQATGWQPHSVRGFLSGNVKKKLGLNVTSETGKDGVRRYRIEIAGPAA